MTALNSPWDLLIHDKELYIAMAGSHQIWKMPLDESEIGPYAGNGREDIVDGQLLPKRRTPRVSLPSPSRAASPPMASGSTWPTAKGAPSGLSPSIPPRKSAPSSEPPNSPTAGCLNSATWMAPRKGEAAALHWGRVREGENLRRRHLQQQNSRSRPQERRGKDISRQREKDLARTTKMEHCGNPPA